MALRILGIGKQLTAVIRKRSEQALKDRLPSIALDLEGAAMDWRNAVRESLNTFAPKPWGPGTPPNRTLWPKRRTGKLYYSILQPKIFWTYRSPTYVAAHGRTTIKFTMSDFYGPIAESGYGDELNTMQDGEAGAKPFAGWKTRANRLLFAAIASRRVF